jgi:MtN3 and saliva related transmembrane protein
LSFASTVALQPIWVEQVGFIAAFCTTAAFVPQLVRVYKLKSARDVSLGTFLMFSVGVFL